MPQQRRSAAPIGSPDWLRALPARWGLRQADACRVMGIARSTYHAKCAGQRPIAERLIGRVVDIEMLLLLGGPPFGWPMGRGGYRLPAAFELTPRTVDHIRNIIAAYDRQHPAANSDSSPISDVMSTA